MKTFGRKCFKNARRVRRMAIFVATHNLDQRIDGVHDYQDERLKIVYDGLASRAVKNFLGGTVYVSEPVTISWNGKPVYHSWESGLLLDVERFNYGEEWYEYLASEYEDMRSKQKAKEIAEEHGKFARFEDLD